MDLMDCVERAFERRQCRVMCVVHPCQLDQECCCHGNKMPTLILVLHSMDDHLTVAHHPDLPIDPSPSYNSLDVVS